MTEISAKKKEQKLIDELTKKTRFDRHCVKKLLDIFKERCDTKKMDRGKFRDFLHNDFGMTDDLLMDRVFRALDEDNDSYLSMSEFVCGLSLLLKGKLEEKIRYCFRAYDLNSDQYISREEMFQLLKNSLVKQPSEEDPDEGIKELVEHAIRKLDMDKDSRVSEADFKASVNEDNILLELFGQVIPSDKYKCAFLVLIGDQSMDHESNKSYDIQEIIQQVRRKSETK